MLAIVLVVVVTIGGVQHPLYGPDNDLRNVDNQIIFDTTDDCRRAAEIAVGIAGEGTGTCYERNASGMLGKVLSESSIGK